MKLLGSTVPHIGRQFRMRPGAVVVVLGVLLGAGLLGPGSGGPGTTLYSSGMQRAQAAFTDAFDSTGGSVATGALDASSLTAQPADGLSAALSWEAAPDQGATPTYTLTRTGPGQENPTEIYSGTSTEFTDPGNLPQEVLDQELIQISAGFAHSLALSADGRIWGWGNNQEGQLGNGTRIIGTAPSAMRLPGNRSATAIAAGGYHGLAIASDGTLWAWGRNNVGQLGVNNEVSSTTPVRVSLPGSRVPETVDAGEFHSVVTASDGTVWAWGNNEFGQLGNASRANSSSPVAVRLPLDLTFASVAAGSHHTLAIANNGSAWAWGFNALGQLGNGNTTNSAVPTRVLIPGPGERSVTGVSVGVLHSLAVTTDGRVLSWGSNGYGQLGHPAPATSEAEPVQLPGNLRAANISAGGFYSLAVARDGSVFSWGRNNFSQLGNGGADNTGVALPVSLPEGTAGTEITAGLHHAILRSTAGGLLAWGLNTSGQLGTGSTAGSAVPVSVADFEGCAAGSVPVSGTNNCSLVEGAQYDYTLSASIGGWSTIGEPVSMMAGVGP